MAIHELKIVDEGTQIANGLQDHEKPLLQQNAEENPQLVGDGEAESIGMVLLTTFVAVFGSFEFGCCVGYSAPTQSAIREDLHISLAEYYMFGSILTMGAMVGAIASGRISDYFGRKWAMRISSFFCIAGWMAMFFSKRTLLLDIGRLFTGYGIGILSYVVPIFIAEIAPTNLRGGLTTLNSLTVGRQKEFRSALRQLRGSNADITQEALDIEESIVITQTLPKAGLMDLFQSRCIRALTIGVGLMAFQQFGGTNGIGFYVNETFIEAGKIGTMAYAVIQVPITVLGALLIDKSGRKPLIMISATGSCIGCFLTATGFLLKSYGAFLGLVPFLGVGGVLIYISAYSIGMGAVPWVIMSEIFPNDVKGVAGSVVVLVNWSGAWIVSYTFNFMMSWSHAGTFYIFALSCALTVLFAAKVMPETKGKTLEEIQASLNSKPETLE